MQEEKARRRVVRGPGPGGLGDIPMSEKEHYDNYDDDEGKDVYNKSRQIQGRLASGRLPQYPQPPPTTIVSHITCGNNV